eukprot:m.442865 g.442865  ORF g.442865 m.442865 type:complete len:678 (-) comp21478_c0_seq1:26-2059(-)
MAELSTCATREAAEGLLRPHVAQRGVYLIRKSLSSHGAFGLSICTGTSIMHYKIDLFPSGKYGIQDGLHFINLEELVAHYKRNKDGLCCAITSNVVAAPQRPSTSARQQPSQGRRTSTFGRRPPPMPTEESEFAGFGDMDSSAPVQPTPPPVPTVPRGGSVRPSKSKQMKVIPRVDLVLGDEIGAGEFGTVFLGEWNSPRGRIPVAIKSLKGNSNPDQKKELMEEARLMVNFDHPNVVTLYGLTVDGELALVCELVPHGALNKYLKSNQFKINVDHQLDIITQIAKGMEYLTAHGVLHRDLAARNVLVKSLSNVKISDFGLSRTTDHDYYQATNLGKWPIKWYALESIYFKRFSEASDVWSFAVTAWEVLQYGRKPYGKLKGQQVVLILDKGVRLPRPDNCSLELYTLLMQCWDKKPALRPTFSAIVRDMQRIGGPATSSQNVQRSASSKSTTSTTMSVAISNQKLYDFVPDPEEAALVAREERSTFLEALRSQPVSPAVKAACCISADDLSINFKKPRGEGPIGKVFTGTWTHHGRPMKVVAKVVTATVATPTFNYDTYDASTPLGILSVSCGRVEGIYPCDPAQMEEMFVGTMTTFHSLWLQCMPQTYACHPLSHRHAHHALHSGSLCASALGPVHISAKGVAIAPESLCGRLTVCLWVVMVSTLTPGCSGSWVG